MRVFFPLFLLFMSIFALGVNHSPSRQSDPDGEKLKRLPIFPVKILDYPSIDGDISNPNDRQPKSFYKPLDMSIQTNTGIRQKFAIMNGRSKKEVDWSQYCASLTVLIMEDIKNCENSKMQTKDPRATLVLKNIGNQEYNSSLPENKVLPVTNNFLIRDTRIEKLNIRCDADGRNVKLKIVNNRMLTNLSINVGFLSHTLTIEVMGNPLLTKETLNKMSQNQKSKVQITYMQDVGECFFNRPVSSFNELMGCTYYKGDLTMDTSTDVDQPFPRDFTNITGCLIIEGTTLNNISFVHQLVTKCDNENKIIKNTNLCLQPEEKKKIIDRLRPVEFSENMGYDTGECEPICSPTHFTDNQDKECKIIEGTWEIEGWDGNTAKFENASQIVEIRGRLTFIGGTMEKLDFPEIFPNLEVINATKRGGNALEIKLNDKLKEIVFKMDLELDVDAHEKKLYVMNNANLDVKENLLKQVNEKYGSDFVQIPPRDDTRLTNVVEIESPTAAKTRKRDSKDDEDEKSGKTVGIVVGVAVTIGVIVLVGSGVGIYFVIKCYKKSKGQVIKKEEKEEEKERELEKQRIEKCIKMKEAEQREFYGAAYISLQSCGSTSFIHRNTNVKEGSWRKDIQDRYNSVTKENETENKISKNDDDVRQIFEPESEVLSDKIIIQTKEIERKIKIDTKQEKHNACEREPAGGDTKPQNNVETVATAENEASTRKRGAELTEEKKVKYEEWKKTKLPIDKLKDDLCLHKKELKIYEDAIEDTVYIRPFKRFDGDREHAKRLHKHREHIINTQWDIDVEGKMEKLVNSHRKKVNDENQNFLLGEPDDCELPVPVPVDDSRKNRKKRAKIYFLNKEVTYPFVTHEFCINTRCYNTVRTKLTELMFAIPTPDIVILPVKYTYKRMKSTPTEIFNEILAHQQENSLPANTFDILAPLEDELKNRDEQEEKCDPFSPCFPKVRLFKFVHTKKAPATKDKDPSLDTLIKCVPIHSDNFIKSIVRAYMSIEMDRWLVLTADEYLQVCKLALDNVKYETSTNRIIPSFRGRIIGEVRGQFDDLRKALCFGNSKDFFGKSEHPMKLTDYVFLGNYIGDGVTNVDTIGLLFALKALRGWRCLLLRGASEWLESVQMTFLKKELQHRFGERAREICGAIVEVFDRLPVSAKIANSIFCTNAGVAPKLLEKYTTKKDQYKQPVHRFDDDKFVRDMMLALPNYTVDFFKPHGLYAAGGYYFGEKQISDCLNGLGMETMFISKPLSSGWGIFGEYPVMYSLASGMNLERTSDKLMMAVAEIDGTEITINVIYQEKMDERTVIETTYVIPEDTTNAKDPKPTKPTEVAGSNNLNTTEIKNTSNVNDKKESNTEPNSKNAKSDAKKPESMNKIVLEPSKGPNVSTSKNTDGAKSAQPEATKIVGNDKNAASATTGQPNETNKKPSGPSKK